MDTLSSSLTSPLFPLNSSPLSHHSLSLPSLFYLFKASFCRYSHTSHPLQSQSPHLTFTSPPSSLHPSPSSVLSSFASSSSSTPLWVLGKVSAFNCTLFSQVDAGKQVEEIARKRFFFFKWRGLSCIHFSVMFPRVTMPLQFPCGCFKFLAHCAAELKHTLSQQIHTLTQGINRLWDLEPRVSNGV